MKKAVTVEKIKELVEMSIEFEKVEHGNGSDWDDIFLEPALMESHDVTLAFIESAEKHEFEVVSCYFGLLIRKFNSETLLSAVLSQYKKLYGDDTDNEVYQYDIKGLENWLKK